MADTVLTELKIHDFDTLEQMSQYESEIGDNDLVLTPDTTAKLFLFKHAWADYLVSDMSWLCADTFSWHSGDMYNAAYEHLVAEQNGTRYYAWVRTFDSIVYYTTVETPGTHDVLYRKNTDGEFIEDSAKVWEGGSESIIDSYGDELVRDSSKDETVLRNQTDTIGDITITYYLARDGHKICLPDQESNLVALCEATGVAWYYLLDTENKQFKLPREDKDGKYLYFYVGNFEQTAVEQTAGLNTELFNGKADVATVNGIDSRVEALEGYDYVVESQQPTADNGYTWYRKYKSGWVEQGGKVGALNNSRITVTLPIIMANNSYVAVATGRNDSSASNYAVAIVSPSTTQIIVASTANYGAGATWQVSGMSAQ